MLPRNTPKQLKIAPQELLVEWADGHESRFHFLWLRDACRCQYCGEPSFGDKRIVLSELPVDLHPMTAHVDNDSQVVVQWGSENHESTYDGEWLRNHCYSKGERERRRFRPTLWHGDAPPDVSPFVLSELIADEALQYQMLERLHRSGIVFFAGTPAETGVESVADLIGYLRETNYGRVYDIKVEPNPGTFANLPGSTPLHTDDAFRPFPPGLTMLQCVQPSTDGEGASIFCDGFDIVRRLGEQSPAAVKILSELPLRFSRHHPDADDFRSHGTMIRLDDTGELAAVRLGLHNISPPDIDADRIEEYYQAIILLDRLVRDPTLRIRRRLAAGDLVLLDNERVMHGRESFSAEGGRHIRGGFVDRDALHSRWRVLSRRLGHTDNLYLEFPGSR